MDLDPMLKLQSCFTVRAFPLIGMVFRETASLQERQLAIILRGIRLTKEQMGLSRSTATANPITVCSSTQRPTSPRPRCRRSRFRM